MPGSEVRCRLVGSQPKCHMRHATTTGLGEPAREGTLRANRAAAGRRGPSLPPRPPPAPLVHCPAARWRILSVVDGQLASSRQICFYSCMSWAVTCQSSQCRARATTSIWSTHVFLGSHVLAAVVLPSSAPWWLVVPPWWRGGLVGLRLPLPRPAPARGY